MNSAGKKLIVGRLREHAEAESLRITGHAHKEMMEENIDLAEVIDVLKSSSVLEDYPEHKRGPCCLVCGQTRESRFLHVVCTTSLDITIVITVYEPGTPKWITPFERRR